MKNLPSEYVYITSPIEFVGEMPLRKEAWVLRRCTHCQDLTECFKTYGDIVLCEECATSENIEKYTKLSDIESIIK